MGYQVTVPLAQVRRTDGSYVHVYEGGLLPADVAPDVLAHLVDGNLVVEVSVDEPVDEPAGNASHDDWVAYAVSQGMSEDEAEALSRDELRDLYK